MNYAHRNAALILADPGRAHRLMLWLRRGPFEFNSDFSGIMCFDDSCRWHLEAAAHQLGIPTPGMETWRCCDNSDLCQQVMSRRDMDIPGCLFGDIWERVPALHRSRLMLECPWSEHAAPEDNESANKRLLELCSEHCLTLWPAHATSFDMITMQAQCVHRPRSVLVADAVQVAPMGGDRHCNPQPPQLGKVVVVSGGTPCLPFTRRNIRGRHKGFAHQAMRATCAWVGERRARGLQGGLEDLVFHENVPGFPAEELLVAPLRGTHTVRSVICGPDGWCSPRLRRHSVLFGNKYVWMGQEDHQADFDRIFSEKCMIPAPTFFVDSAANQQDHWAVGCPCCRTFIPPQVPISESTHGAASAVLDARPGPPPPSAILWSVVPAACPARTR